MPVDSKRIQGPDDTQPYSIFVEGGIRNEKQLAEHLLDEQGLREDGRESLKQRKIYCKTGVVSQAKGSAYVEVGNTKVICSVFDPREIPNRSEFGSQGELYCYFKFAPFSCHLRRAHQQDAEEREMSLNLRRALEPAVCRHEFPNFQVDVSVLVLESDGGALPAAITCASLALADASVPMYDLVTGVSMGVYGKSLFLDPSAKEERVCNWLLSSESHGVITLAVMPAQKQIAQLWQCGAMSGDHLIDVIGKLSEACEQTYLVSQRCLYRSVSDTVNQKKDESPAVANK